MHSEMLTDLIKKAYEALQEYLNLPTIESLKNIDWSDIGGALATIGSILIFVMGRIIGKTKLFGIEIDYPEYLLPALIVTMMLPVSASISTILFVFFYYGILYKLYKLKWKGFAAVALFISLFVPVFQPIFLFFSPSISALV